MAEGSGQNCDCFEGFRNLGRDSLCTHVNNLTEMLTSHCVATPLAVVTMVRTQISMEFPNMTEPLQRAFDTASQLSPADQDAFGNWLLAELESERNWAERFRGSQDKLASLASDALAEHDRGETSDLEVPPNSR